MNTFHNNKHTFRFFLIFLIFIFGKNGIAQTMIIGKVYDAQIKIIVGADITLYRDGNLIQKRTTDINGNYSFKVDPGTYEIEFSEEGVLAETLIGVIAMEEQITKVNYRFINEGFGYCELVISRMRIQLAKREKMEKGQTFVEQTFLAKPNREINQMILMTPGVTFGN